MIEENRICGIVWENAKKNTRKNARKCGDADLYGNMGIYGKIRTA